jgi:succinate-semialdehyde dehydrogenase / glutarate-semialdehyde dehydrogenase
MKIRSGGVLGVRTELYIGGEWRPGSAGDSIEVLDPGTGRPTAVVASASPDDAVAAVAAAAAAQPEWAARAPRDRAEILRECWRLIQRHADELARLIVREQGKPLTEALGELDYAAEFFRWNAEETVRIGGRLAPTPSGLSRVLVGHHPVGVVVMVTPWNFPAAMITRKVAPALGAGNAVVVKPAAETPLTALHLGELMAEAGVPAGVVNILPSNRPGEWFDAAISHPATRMISFTGSTRVGRELLAKASGRVLKSTMELGGNAPFVVLEGADVDMAVEGALYAKMRHTGQTCVAANRFFVHESLAAAFTDQLSDAMSRMRIGTGLEPGVECGPVISATAADRLDRTVETAVAEGATVVTGGSRVPRAGYFFEPTVLTHVPPGAAILDQELFGPVAPVIAYDDVDDMLALANSTEMGLAGYVFCPELGRGLAVAERLQVGMVGLNRGYASDPSAPFGGMKQSGLGREGGVDGIYEFCETQFVATGW